MTKYFTSDTHFAHPFVAALRGYAKTGFTSDNTIKQQANEAHMQVKDCVNWYRHDMDVTGHINEMVGENDELYILGDLCSGGAWSLQQALMHVKSLRCPRNNRHLILGNHDDVLYGKSKGFKDLTEAFGEIGRIGMRFLKWGRTCDCCTVTPMRTLPMSSRTVTKSTWDWTRGTCAPCPKWNLFACFRRTEVKKGFEIDHSDYS